MAATTGITVQYDATTFSPTPIVNYSRQPLDFGYVYGYNTDITLEGLYTGISTTGAAISFLTGAFANQFRALTVTDNGGVILYQWSGVTVENVSFETNPYFQGSFVKYSIKLKSFDFPSGVIEPSNEYAFAQNEDGTINATHKISARGIRNSAGAFDNAIAFVKQFTGKNPYANCAPYFVPSGSGILTSINESINRADAIYSVSEVYRYNSGAITPYLKTTSLAVNEAIDSEFRTIDYGVKLQGSPVLKNVGAIISSLNYSVLSDIQSEYGYNTGNWVKNTYSANVDSGVASVDIQIGYISGANVTGYFDNEVVCEIDNLAGTEQWKVNGEFKCQGPLEYKRKQLLAFKQNNVGDEWEPYLSGVVASSPIFSILHDSNKLFSQNIKLEIVEDPNLATLRLTATIADGYEPDGLTNLNYSWEVTPSQWIYEILPSATIEGSYVIQDLQTKTQTRQKIALTSKANDVDWAIGVMSGYMSKFASTYVDSGTSSNVKAFMTEERVVTGTYDANYSTAWVGADSGLSSGTLALQSIGSINDVAPIRPAGYNFGY